jgi:hypothetical protein
MSDSTAPGANGRHDALLAKVRKLLAKAEDPAVTDAEAEVYNAKAAELIAAYGIDRALLAASEPDTDRIGDRVVVLDAPYARDKADLLHGIAKALRCRTVLRNRWAAGRRELSLHLFGYASDLQRVELLYTSLLLQATTGMLRARAPYFEDVRAFRRSWLNGFTAAVVRRLNDAEHRARSDAEHRHRPTGDPGRSVALVLADRSALVVQAVHDTYPQLGKGRTRALSGSGRRDGWNAGQRADLGGTTRVGASAHRAVGGRS